jgi:hypothetical protein
MDLSPFPYNYFKTKQNISLIDLESIKDVFKFSFQYEKSILNMFKGHLDNFVKTEKYDMRKIESMSNLDALNKIYSEILIRDKNINKFVESFINYKYGLIKKDELYKEYVNIRVKFLTKKTLEYDSSFFIINPVNYLHINSFETITDEINIYSARNTNITTNRIQLTLDIFTQGNFINYSLPSVGIIYPNFSKNPGGIEPNNYVDFIKLLVNKDINNESINKNLPLLTLNIPLIVTELLLTSSGTNNNILNSNIFSNNTNVKKLIIKNIEEIKIDLAEIFYQNYENKNKNKNKNKTVKAIYIIPYKLKDGKIVVMNNSEVKSMQRKNIKEVMTHNYQIATENKNTKACYLFYIIQLLYDINKAYINKINDIITNISESREKIFKRLNIKNAFSYISLLSTSLLKFKLILLNNFYNLFIPSSVTYDNYGMKVMDSENNNYALIPESKFISSDEYILDNYCFHKSENELYVNEDKLKKFIMNTKYDHDAFDINEKLEFGGYAFNIENMEVSMNIFLNYLSNLKKTNHFSLYIIKLLSDNFIQKKLYPYELIDNLLFSKQLALKTPKITKVEEEKLIKELKNTFDVNYNASVLFLFKLIELNKKWDKIKERNINKSIIEEKEKKREMLLLCTRLYMFVAMSNYYICKNVIVDVEFRNKLIKEFQTIKKKYEKRMIDYLEKKNLNIGREHKENNKEVNKKNNNEK